MRIPRCVPRWTCAAAPTRVLIRRAQAEVVAANARQALTVGHSYLLSHLDPATPVPLAAAIRNFTERIESVAIHALAGVNPDDPAQASRIRDFVTLDEQITGLCK